MYKIICHCQKLVCVITFYHTVVFFKTVLIAHFAPNLPRPPLPNGDFFQDEIFYASEPPPNFPRTHPIFVLTTNSSHKSSSFHFKPSCEQLLV